MAGQLKLKDITEKIIRASVKGHHWTWDVHLTQVLNYLKRTDWKLAS